ncbi:hypothetical protein HanPI659440_Chr08g0292751 [Helianthus annuus]|nr:hypothetical protein HanPI659440_Chr08g0292751 [Helianthus annuus]
MALSSTALIWWWIKLVFVCRMDNNSVGVRVEDVIRTNEARGLKTRTKIALIVALIIFILLGISFISYLYIAPHILDTNHPQLKTTYIQSMSLNICRNNTDSLAKLGLHVSFNAPDNIKADPELGTFILSTKVSKNHTLRAFLNSAYTISKYDQVILLNFRTNQTYMKEQQPGVLWKKDHQFIWVRITGDFKMKLKLARFPRFPQAYHHIYFLCDISFRAIQLDKIYYQKCVTSLSPSNL